MITWMREKLYGSRQKFVNIWTRRFEASPRSNEDTNTDVKMFVSDTNLFSNTDSVRLTILSDEGDSWTLDAESTLTVEKLKTMAVGHFYSPLECSKTAPNYKLVLVSGRKALEDGNSLLQEGLKDNDEILLVEHRPSSSKEQFTEESLRGPAIEEINLATQHLEEKNKLKLHPPIECTADSEIRKILISLVEASARLLTPSQSAEEVFEIIRERMDAKSKAQPNPRAVHQLMDMGFSEELCTIALRLNRMNRSEALEWLLEHEAEVRATSSTRRSEEVRASSSTRRPEEVRATSSTRRPEEVRATSSTRRPVLETPVASTSSATAPACTSDTTAKEHQDKMKKKEQQSITKSVAALLESFREHKRQEFKPNERALKNLLDMGFEEKDIREALRITGNNQSAACEWLLGERRPSLEDLDTGLDPEGPIYKAIMANPAIQLSLTSPKMLLAFLSMLENPSSANMWINDPDASPVLSQIFKTYHAEKHALQMNRYVEQQQVWNSSSSRHS